MRVVFIKGADGHGAMYKTEFHIKVGVTQDKEWALSDYFLS